MDKTEYQKPLIEVLYMDVEQGFLVTPSINQTSLSDEEEYD